MLTEANDRRPWALIRNLEGPSHALLSGPVDGHADSRRGCLAGATGAPLAGNEELLKTDEQIVDLVYEALRSSGYGQLRILQVYCDNGRVTLQGRLPSYYLKQVAQTTVHAIDGVHDIDNDIRVVSSW